MEMWKECLLGDVADWGAGGTPSRGNKEYYIGKIPWIKSGELKNKYLLDTEEKISQKAIENSSAKIFPKGSVAIAMYGATIGKTSILGIDASSNQAVAVAKPHPDKIVSEFLYYYLLSKEKDFINLGQGGAQPNISQAVLKSFEFKYPSIKTQKLIINKIDSLFAEIDAGVEELKKTKEKLELYKQSVLNAAIRGKLVPQDPNDEPASKLLERIRAEKEKLIKEGKIKKEKPLPPIDPSEIPFELPKGWEWVRLSDIMELITKGSSPNWQGVKYVSKDEGIAFITSKNVQRFYIEYQNLEYVEEKFNKIEPRSILKSGDVLTNIVGASIGRTAIFSDSFVANINQAVCILRPINRAFSEWVESYLNSPVALEMMNSGKVEMARANLGMSEIAKFLIPIPALSHQQNILNYVRKIIKDANEQQEFSQKLIEESMLMKQSILKMAFEGKLI